MLSYRGQTLAVDLYNGIAVQACIGYPGVLRQNTNVGRAAPGATETN